MTVQAGCRHAAGAGPEPQDPVLCQVFCLPFAETNLSRKHWEEYRGESHQDLAFFREREKFLLIVFLPRIVLLVLRRYSEQMRVPGLLQVAGTSHPLSSSPGNHAGPPAVGWAVASFPATLLTGATIRWKPL